MTAQISSASTAIALGCGAADQAGALRSRGLDAAEAVVAIAPAGYHQVRQLPFALARTIVTVALVGLSGCGPRVWTARFYNNTSQPLNVLVASGHDEVRYKIPPQAIGFILIGRGPSISACPSLTSHVERWRHGSSLLPDLACFSLVRTE